jgi:hypothetical protein
MRASAVSPGDDGATHGAGASSAGRARERIAGCAANSITQALAA